MIPDYIQAICIELAFLVVNAPEPITVKSIYIGGGTPSLLPIEEIDRILRVVNNCYMMPNNVEITLEANPGALSEIYLSELMHTGVNRLSIGMQSSVPKYLALLGQKIAYQYSIDLPLYASILLDKYLKDFQDSLRE